MASTVERSAEYTGGPIRLLACDAGGCNATAAQNLANKMGVEVLAPTEKVFAYPSGRLVVAQDINAAGRIVSGGEWKSFYPGG